MNVLHVSDSDLRGKAFSGFDLLSALPARGIVGRQAVLRKASDDPRVVSLLRGPEDERLFESVCTVETRNSIHCLLHPWGRVLAGLPEFEAADVVHYHLVNNRIVSLLDLPWLTSLKASVWSIHDPWAFTGHCIYPRDCDKWISGCEGCPSLDVPYPMLCDRAGQMWRIKRDVYSRMDVETIVASEHMLSMALRSPLMSQFRHVHRIPYGIDTGSFLPESEKAASRRLLGVPQDDFVIAFRSTATGLKGLPYIVEALSSAPPARPTTLLTADGRHVVDSLSRHYNIVELGWVEDRALHARFLSACDVFLMPSTGEAFGLMAIEAMAAGRPVVCFEGTSVPEVTFAPECGIAVPMGDSAALRAAVDRLAAGPEEARRRGEMGRRLASGHYGHEAYLDALIAVYAAAIEHRRQSGPARTGSVGC